MATMLALSGILFAGDSDRADAIFRQASLCSACVHGVLLLRVRLDMIGSSRLRFACDLAWCQPFKASDAHASLSPGAPRR